jgi:hypothetical protein
MIDSSSLLIARTVAQRAEQMVRLPTEIAQDGAYLSVTLAPQKNVVGF